MIYHSYIITLDPHIQAYPIQNLNHRLVDLSSCHDKGQGPQERSFCVSSDVKVSPQPTHMPLTCYKITSGPYVLMCHSLNGFPQFPSKNVLDASLSQRHVDVIYSTKNCVSQNIIEAEVALNGCRRQLQCEILLFSFHQLHVPQMHTSIGGIFIELSSTIQKELVQDPVVRLSMMLSRLLASS